MTSDEVRKKYIDFFKEPPRNHKEIKPSPLVLEDDPTTLFTSAGMQQLVPYLSGKKEHPRGKRLVDSQPCFRAVDMDKVGDNRHTTFFEMLGNWSLGDYFKEEEIPWLWEFLTKRLSLSEERLFVTAFKGASGVPKDTESYEIWKRLGVPDQRISFYGIDENWWSVNGSPETMLAGDIGGPSTEVFYKFENVSHDKKYGEKCHPNCDCGRFIEIANSVFIQYIKSKEGKLIDLPQKNVDHGGGLERIVAAVNNTPDVFLTDLFEPILNKIEEISGKPYEENQIYMRRMADHLKAATFIIAEGIKPSKEGHGSVLRRLIRKSVDSARAIGIRENKVATFAKEIVKVYEGLYANLSENLAVIEKELSSEEYKYTTEVLSEKSLSKVRNQQMNLPVETYPMLTPIQVSGTVAYNSLASTGTPLEVSFGYAREVGTISSPVDEEKWWKAVKVQKDKHRNVSRKGSIKKFSKKG